MRRALAIPALLLLLLTRPGMAEPDDHAARARACFLRGIELYDERDFGGALVELRRAYELLPNYRILFNLGRVAVELHDYASAIGFFKRYLDEGGAQVPPDRRHELDEELARLGSRVGRIKLLTDESGEEVFVDDTLVGRAPLAPLTVNVGRHRLEIRPRQGVPHGRTVEVAGQETVEVRMTRAVPDTTSLPTNERADRTLMVEQSRDDRTVGGPSLLWVGWTATALCAGGASVFGLMALRSAQDLRDLRQSYPVTAGALDSKQKSTRTLSLVADGLLAGTVAFGGLSLYFTLSSRTKHEEPKPRMSVGFAWPGIVHLKGRF